MTNQDVFQEEAVQSVTNYFKNVSHKYAMVVAGTGSGKTRLFDKFILQKVAEGKRCLVLAGNPGLLEHAEKEMVELRGESIKDYIHWEYGNKSKDKLVNNPEKAAFTNIVLSTNQTLKNERLSSYPPDYFDYIIIDECHHSLAATYQSILSHFFNADVLGVTATPVRGNDEETEWLMGLFDIVYSKPLSECIKDGIASTFTIQQSNIQLDLNNLQLPQNETSDSFTKQSLRDTIDCHFDEIIKDIKANISDRKTAVFLQSVDQIKEFVKIANQNGLENVYFVHSDQRKKETQKNLEAFENCKTGLIVSVGKIGEGYDCPSINCIVNLRPTTSERLYRQMLGRGARNDTQSHKTECLIYNCFKFISDKDYESMSQFKRVPKIIDPYMFPIDMDSEVTKDAIHTIVERGYSNDLFECLSDANKQLELASNLKSSYGSGVSDLYTLLYSSASQFDNAKSVYDYINNPEQITKLIWLFTEFDMSTANNQETKLSSQISACILDSYEHLKSTNLFENDDEIKAILSSSYQDIKLNLCDRTKYSLAKECNIGIKYLTEFYKTNKDSSAFIGMNAEEFFKYRPKIRRLEQEYAEPKKIVDTCLELGLDPMKFALSSENTIRLVKTKQKLVQTAQQVKDYLSELDYNKLPKIDETEKSTLVQQIKTLQTNTSFLNRPDGLTKKVYTPSKERGLRM